MKSLRILPLFLFLCTLPTFLRADPSVALVGVKTVIVDFSLKKPLIQAGVDKNSFETAIELRLWNVGLVVYNRQDLSLQQMADFAKITCKAPSLWMSR